MPYQTLRVRAQNLTVPYLHPCGLPAIQTWRIDPDGFAGKKPADRQRFKCSLAEPLLLTVDGDAELRRKIVEWGH